MTGQAGRQLVAGVAVDGAAFDFDKTYDYLLPASFSEFAVRGCRVIVPFGRGNARRQGIILSISASQDARGLKAVADVPDREPVLSEEGLDLVLWLKQRYLCTLFEAVKLVIPAGIAYQLVASFTPAPDGPDPGGLEEDARRVYDFIASSSAAVKLAALEKRFGSDTAQQAVKALTGAGFLLRHEAARRGVGDLSIRMLRLDLEALNQSPPRKLTENQQKVVDLLRGAESLSVKEICYATGVSQAVVQGLMKKPFVRAFDVEAYRSAFSRESEAPRHTELSPLQQQVFEGILSQYREEKASCALLYGVTGSGKTLVYVQLIRQVLRDGKNAILLVPEISLTPQAISIFHQSFPGQIAVLHSGLSAGERADEWKRIKNGLARLVIGTRSAVFAPLERIGLIILDEEQEYTYKSESSPRFHARDVASYRCGRHNALLLLASATPSVESYYHASSGRYRLYQLNQRFSGTPLPRVVVADLRTEGCVDTSSAVSKILYEELEANLAQGKQSILLMNRRGYDTQVSCRSCGQVMMCPSCSIAMTYHSANGRLMCHYCGHSVPYQTKCPSCGGEYIRYSGVGTQKLEKVLQELFPQARVLRMDMDTTMEKNAYEKKFDDFSKGAYDIMIGTQMVAKGLDFPNVTLVGVVNADQALYSDDYRSYERAFSLITQVVGRAGRGDFSGRAVIQTYTPENSVIDLAARQDYEDFYESEIVIRKAMLYPPFCDLCVLGLSGLKEDAVQQGAQTLYWMIRRTVEARYGDLPLHMFQPAQARVYKVADKYRQRIILKCRDSRRFRQMMSQVLGDFSKDKASGKLSFFYDMNPDNIL